jgi:hypothetical protein
MICFNLTPSSDSLGDLEEVIHLLRDHPPGQMVRCSKVRAMFASRACRKSVMVGDALTPKQMAKVSPKAFFPHLKLTNVIDCSAYGYDGSTLELSPWPTHDAAFDKFG